MDVDESEAGEDGSEMKYMEMGSPGSPPAVAESDHWAHSPRDNNYEPMDTGPASPDPEGNSSDIGETSNIEAPASPSGESFFSESESGEEGEYISSKLKTPVSPQEPPSKDLPDSKLHPSEAETEPIAASPSHEFEPHSPKSPEVLKPQSPKSPEVLEPHSPKSPEAFGEGMNDSEDEEGACSPDDDPSTFSLEDAPLKTKCPQHSPQSDMENRQLITSGLILEPLSPKSLSDNSESEEGLATDSDGSMDNSGQRSVKIPLTLVPVSPEHSLDAFELDDPKESKKATSLKIPPRERNHPKSDEGEYSEEEGAIEDDEDNDDNMSTENKSPEKESLQVTISPVKSVSEPSPTKTPREETVRRVTRTESTLNRSMHEEHLELDYDEEEEDDGELPSDKRADGYEADKERPSKQHRELVSNFFIPKV